MDKVIAHAPAKINLALEVKSLTAGEEKHRLDSLFCTTTLTDTLVFSFESSREPFSAKVKFESADFDTSFIMEDDNTLTKTVELFEQEYGVSFLPSGTLTVQLIKSIPTQAGLGGGSSDAAAMLRMLCWLAQVEPLSERSLKVAQAVGADVPFFLHASKQGLCARMGGYGDELLEAVPKPELSLALVKPQRGISTKKAYAEFDKGESAGINNSELTGSASGSVEELSAALKAGKDASVLATLCTNNFEPVALKLVPAIAQVKEELKGLSGVLGVTLSGSGSALFAICESAEASRMCVQHFAKQDLWAVAVQT